MSVQAYGWVALFSTTNLLYLLVVLYVAIAVKEKQKEPKEEKEESELTNLLSILTKLLQFSGLTSSRKFWEFSKGFSAPARMVHISGL